MYLINEFGHWYSPYFLTIQVIQDSIYVYNRPKSNCSQTWCWLIVNLKCCAMGWRCRIWFKSPGALHKDHPPRISLKYARHHARPLYIAYSNPKKIPQGRYFNRKEAEGSNQDQREGSNLLLHKCLISGVRILALLTALGPSTSYSALWASVSVSVNYRLNRVLGKGTFRYFLKNTTRNVRRVT